MAQLFPVWLHHFGPVFFTALLQFTGHSLVHFTSFTGSPGLQVQVWTFTKSFQNLESFICHPFFCRSAAAFGIFVQLQPTFSCQTDGATVACLLHRGVHGPLSDSLIISLPPPCLTEEFLLKCCVWFPLRNNSILVSSVQRTLFQKSSGWFRCSFEASSW